MRKLLSTFALAGFVGLVACEPQGDDVFIDEPVVEQPAPAPVTEPPVTTPPPMTPAQDDTLLLEDDTVGVTTEPATTTDPM